MFIEETKTYVNEQFESKEFKEDQSYNFMNCAFFSCSFINTEKLKFIGCFFYRCFFEQAKNLEGYNQYITFWNCTLNEVTFSEKLEHFTFDYCYFDTFILINANFEGEVTNCTFRHRFSVHDCNIKRIIFRLNVLDNKVELDVDNISIENPSDNEIFPNIFSKNYLPDGDFIGYKQVKTAKGDRRILTLLIPADAQRVCTTGYKARASKVKVLKAEDLIGGDVNETEFYSDRGGLYKVGEIATPDHFDPSPLKTCSNGIHFFLNKQEAKFYPSYY